MNNRYKQFFSTIKPLLETVNGHHQISTFNIFYFTAILPALRPLAFNLWDYREDLAYLNLFFDIISTFLLLIF